MTRIELCTARLMGEEGIRRFAYNDTTGKQVSLLPEGRLSIGIGINLETGLDMTEITFLLSHRLTITDTALRKYDWYVSLDEPRGSVFCDIGYNAGIHGLLNFTSVIHYASEKAWPRCAQSLMQSKAAQELPTRYKRLEQIILTGET